MTCRNGFVNVEWNVMVEIFEITKWMKYRDDVYNNHTYKYILKSVVLFIKMFNKSYTYIKA